ncbi:MAG: hypothetical protein J6V13_02620 [Paludibacteraceae bacterium]|nr:hypothetical protein [Paludibacteraceae bacterium]
MKSLEKIKLAYVGMICLFLTTSVQSQAYSFIDSVNTVHKKGVFHTYCQVATHSDIASAEEVVDDFISEFRGDPLLLFEWAMKGVGQQNDAEKDAIILHLKETTFNPETSIGVIKTDIEVPGFTTYKDVSLESRVLKHRLPSGELRVDVDIFYSNALLKKAYGSYHVIPLDDNKLLLCMNTYIRFGWFFDLFVTNRRYKNLVEFRVVKFMNNMSEASEKRMKEK